jgi:hypothetical protein
MRMQVLYAIRVPLRTHRPILDPHIVQQPLKPLTRLIRRPKHPRYLLIPLHTRFKRPIEHEERQDGVL